MRRRAGTETREAQTREFCAGWREHEFDEAAFTSFAAYVLRTHADKVQNGERVDVRTRFLGEPYIATQT